MMRLKVTFHGLCLFTTRDTSHRGAFTVLLPRAHGTGPGGKGKAKDGRDVDHHNAGLLQEMVPDDPMRVLHHFADSTVWFVPIDNQTGSAGVVGAPLTTVPDIRRFTKDVELDWNARPIARVELDIPGAVTTNDEGADVKRDWDFGKTLHSSHGYSIDEVAESVSWTVDYPRGVMVVVRDEGGSPKVRTFTDDVHLHIVNVCGDMTDVNTRRAGQSAQGPKVPDNDFKWFYELLEGPRGKKTLKERTYDDNRKQLPVPEAVYDPSDTKSMERAPDTPTCLCGFFCEVPDCPNH